MRSIFPAACRALKYPSTLSHKLHDIWKNVIKPKTGVIKVFYLPTVAK